MTWTWVPMLDSDSAGAAEEMAQELGGTHFWDGRRQAAAAFAAGLGSEGQLAWDAYLFFARGATWKDPAPHPADWAHQLGAGGWADAGKFAWGTDLTARLREFAQRGAERGLL